VTESPAVNKIVDVVVIRRRKSRENYRAAGKVAGGRSAAKELRRVQRPAFDRKLLRGIDGIPGEVARLGECSHRRRLGRKPARARPEAALKELRVEAV
jgi:hypothetical protein